MTDIQYANTGKRIFAATLDGIIIAIVAVGIALLLSFITDVAVYSEKYDEIVARYETEYGVSFDITADEYEALSDEAKADYKYAVDACNSDEEANEAYLTSVKLILIITVASLSVSMLVFDFAVPLFIGDGRTLAKFFMGIGVMRTNAMSVSPTSLFIRTLIGKCAIEIIAPALLITAGLSGIMTITCAVLLVALFVVQIIVCVKTNGLLHDKLADTTVVDWGSQRIFESQAELEEYEKKTKILK